MNFNTINNLLFTIVWGALGIGALIGVLFCGATWHIPTAIISLAFAYVNYTDDSYGEESVQSFINRKIKSK